ncbi:Rbm34 [Symbiodinium pilosum]|uniref:Rbm34 protein n=1 Tax=Symbiodinium pilosum TaxID=2952 RepID=A0A812UCZ1_SYMPI|nr:Rbm34 [Symbiodinium pilosum]
MGSVCISVRPAGEKHEGGGKKKSNDDLTIVIKGFPEHADEASLSAFFSSCGEVARVNLPRNKQDGKLKAAGFIEFKTQDGFNNALKYDNFLYMGCPLRIKAAADKGKGGGKGKDKEDEVTIVVP